MANDSSTGGFLAPSSTNNDLNDAALYDFLQSVIVGVTGIAGNLVRPRFQPEPPNVPDLGITWAAVGPSQRNRDSYSAIIQKATGAIVVRNRTLGIIASFYGPQAETYGELLANGLEIPQNRDALKLNGFNLVSGVSGPIIAPAILKGQWYYRADYTFSVRQQQQYTYPILTVESAQATLELQQPGSSQIIDENLNVKAPA
jgi:hypothetical protein